MLGVVFASMRIKAALKFVWRVGAITQLVLIGSILYLPTLSVPALYSVLVAIYNNRGTFK